MQQTSIKKSTRKDQILPSLNVCSVRIALKFPSRHHVVACWKNIVTTNYFRQDILVMMMQVSNKNKDKSCTLKSRHTAF